MIPVRVDPKIQPHVAARGKRIDDEHPLFGHPCPVCDGPLAGLVSLVFVGRDEPGWTAAAVAVHDECTGVPADSESHP